jgi:hypothetical protein
VKILTGKRQYLDAMGIDVWSVRPALPVPAPTSSGGSPLPDLVKAIGASPEPVRKATAPLTEKPAIENAAKPAPVEAEIPRFRFALLHYGTLGVCISLGETDSLPRRFCDDLARVLGGDLEGLRYHELTWPMLDTAGIDQSVNAARVVVTQKLKSLPARVVVIGEDVAEYYGPLRDIGDQPLNVGNQSYLLVPSMARTFSSAEIKRSLFVALQTWRNSR